jgi:hypothetical protein
MCSGPLCELELRHSPGRLKIEWTRGVIAGRQRRTALHDLVRVEQRWEDQADGARVNEVVEPPKLSSRGQGGAEQLVVDASRRHRFGRPFGVTSDKPLLKIADGER